MTCGQWSRPTWALIFGVRPNSPMTTTVQSLSRPRCVQVLDQGADALVEDREVLLLRAGRWSCWPGPRRSAAVPVPLAVVERDDAGAGLDQPAGHQQALRHARGAVAVHEHLRVAGAVAGDDAAGPPSTGRAPRPACDEVSSPNACSVKASIALHRAAGVDVAAHVVEAPAAASCGRRAGRRVTPRRTMSSRAGPIGRNGASARAEEAGAGLVVRAVRAGVAEADERRHRRIGRPLQLGDRRAELRPAAGRRRLLRVVAVEDLDGVVVGLVADQRADDDELVHHPRQPRERLADLDAGDVGRDRPPRPGDLLRGVGLEVEHVLVRRPADQVDQDDRLVRPPPRLGLGPQEARAASARRGRAPPPEETSPR